MPIVPAARQPNDTTCAKVAAVMRCVSTQIGGLTKLEENPICNIETARHQPTAIIRARLWALSQP